MTWHDGMRLAEPGQWCVLSSASVSSHEHWQCHMCCFEYESHAQLELELSRRIRVPVVPTRVL